MLAPHNDGEITFYEELGLAPDASPEEIRDAFRLFVRLLHPDQQRDPQLKEIAEKQMRKLNRIHAVLSDPVQRRRYDEVLDAGYAPAIVFNSPAPGTGGLRARLAWSAAILVSAGLLAWLASDNTPAVQSRAPEPLPVAAPAAAPAFPSLSRISELQSELRAAIVERDAAIRELKRVRGTRESRPRQSANSSTAWPLALTEPRAALTITELPSAPKPTDLTNPISARAERPANRRLAGFWFYAKPPQGQVNKNQTLYPPEFIEATITEEGGVIRGSFRSRFRIVDRAISPDVNFIFSGTMNGAQVNCPWTGAAGAKGDLTLKLTSENSMRIDWTATELGGQQGLNSGTAVLTRRIE